MIVRVLHDNQYRLESSYLDELNGLDNRLVEVVNSGDEESFRNLLGEMVALVKSKGEALSPYEIATSDVILPAEDLTLAEAQKLFVGQGVVPG